MASVRVLVEYCDRHPSARAVYYAVNGLLEISLCQHCASRHVKVLVDQQFDLIPIPDVTGRQIEDAECVGG
jgi:hypothetical protein